MTQRTRMTPDARRAQMLEVACSIAKKQGLSALTRTAVAAQAGVTVAMINIRFGGIDYLRGEVLQAAATRGDVDWLQSAHDQGWPVSRLEMNSKTRKALNLR